MSNRAPKPTGLGVLPANMQVCLAGTDEQPDLAQWQAVFHDVTPAEISRNIAKAAGPGNEASVEVVINPDNEKTHIILRHNPHLQQGGQDKNFIEFRIDNPEEAKLSSADFDSTQCGHHITKGYMHAMGELLRRIGIRELTVNTQEIGGYAWAQYGLRPCGKESWDKLRATLKDRIVQGGNAVKFDGRSYPIQPAERTAINRILSCAPDQLDQGFYELTSLRRPVGEHEGHPLTVGKALLLNTCWEGAMPLIEGDPGYERFKTYTASSQQQMQSL